MLTTLTGTLAVICGDDVCKLHCNDQNSYAHAYSRRRRRTCSLPMCSHVAIRYMLLMVDSCSLLCFHALLAYNFHLYYHYLHRTFVHGFFRFVYVSFVYIWVDAYSHIIHVTCGWTIYIYTKHIWQSDKMDSIAVWTM